jgi:hypothetical protein
MNEVSNRWSIRGVELAHEALSQGLQPSELNSLLLTVAARRATATTPARLLQQWGRDRFVAPAAVDQRLLRRIEIRLLEQAAAFEAVELSPLAPLATCSAVALTSQNRVVTTMRGTEVVADPTNVLALIAAQRLRVDAATAVKLATAHRCVRTQAVPPGKGFQAHFSLFCMASAGHERSGHGFVVDSMAEQIDVLVAALQELGTPRTALRLLASPERAHLAQRVASKVQVKWPALAVEYEGQPAPYYDGGLRFMIDGLDTDRERYPLADGGAFNWLRRLASNDKLAFVASGLGTQLLAARATLR